jgi:hypothetical protein
MAFNLLHILLKLSLHSIKTRADVPDVAPSRQRTATGREALR